MQLLLTKLTCQICDKRAPLSKVEAFIPGDVIIRLVCNKCLAVFLSMSPKKPFVGVQYRKCSRISIPDSD